MTSFGDNQGRAKRPNSSSGAFRFGRFSGIDRFVRIDIITDVYVNSVTIISCPIEWKVNIYGYSYIYGRIIRQISTQWYFVVKVRKHNRWLWLNDNITKNRERCQSLEFQTHAHTP